MSDGSHKKRVSIRKFSYKLGGGQLENQIFFEVKNKEIFARGGGGSESKWPYFLFDYTMTMQKVDM